MTTHPARKERSFFALNSNDNIISNKMMSLFNPIALLPPNVNSLCSSFDKLMISSVSHNTWNKHSSALSLYSKFCNNLNLQCSLPFPLKNVRAFTTWALTERGLQTATVKSYLCSLKIIHDLNDFCYDDFLKDRCIKMLLSGASNLSLPNNSFRPAMNFPLLKILSHRISETRWSEYSKQIIWTAFAICFFTSCRMGEIVCEKEYYCDMRKTLKWENIVFSDNDIVIFVPYTKATGFKGAFVDIFPLENSPYCPFSAISKLSEMARDNPNFSLKNPVFKFWSGKFLCPQKLNSILKDLLADFCTTNCIISCHSFRAAIPSLLAAHPDKTAIADILEWGRWSSNSYKKYTRYEVETKRMIFNKIVSLF